MIDNKQIVKDALINIANAAWVKEKPRVEGQVDKALTALSKLIDREKIIEKLEEMKPDLRDCDCEVCKTIHTTVAETLKLLEVL